MGHGQAEVDDLRRNQARRALLAGPDGEPVVPEGAVGFVRSRRDLARFFEKDQAETVRRVITEGLEQGQSLKQVMGSLEEALPGKMGRARLENIARTEATTAYNQGRLAMFLDTEGFIAGVEFMAILDARTTDICQHRDGLLFRLDDPAIRQNTPPLHYQCRSILSPVPVTALKESDLERTRQRMATAPDPQVTKTGRFGNEPWPDVQGGGGAAPMPRAKPVGPKGPAGGGEAARTERTPRGPKGGDEGEARAPEPRAKEAGRVEPEPARSSKRPTETLEGDEAVTPERTSRSKPAEPKESGPERAGPVVVKSTPAPSVIQAPTSDGPQIEPEQRPIFGGKFLTKRRITGQGRRVDVDLEDIDFVENLYARSAYTVLPGMDNRDVEIVGRYVLRAADNEYVWNRMKAGKVDGLALMIHEMHELQFYFDNGLDPWVYSDWNPSYDRFHGIATVLEHSFLLAVAKQKGYGVSDIWELIAADRNSTPGSATRKQLRRARRENLDRAAVHHPMTTGSLGEAKARLREANRFWADIYEGRLRLEDIDLDAIPVPGR